MQDLEEQAIIEESRSCNAFLSACQVVLYSSPPLLKSALVASYHILLGQTPLLPPLTLPQRTSPMGEQPTAASSPTLVPKQSPRPKRWHPLPDPMESMPIGSATPKATSGEPPAPRGERSHIGSQHSNPTVPRHLAETLTWWRRPEENTSPSTPLTSPQTATVTSLGCLSIWQKCWPPRHFYLWNPITLDWTRRAKTSKLHLAIPTQGFEVSLGIPPSESPKVMGLMGIHDLDALHCFGSITYCPWCGKQGQNEGTVVNHLQTTHYRLGLVCDRCYSCPSTMFNTLCCHGWHDCHWPRETIPSPSNIQQPQP